MLRDIKEAIHGLDDTFLINKFISAAEYSMDDEFIQILLQEIKIRNLTLEQVLKDMH